MVVSRTQVQHREFAVTRLDLGPATPLKNWFWLVLSLLALSTSWFYKHRIQGPWEYLVNVDSGKMKAQLGDLFSPWVGTRGLLLYGRNPYGPEVSREIQLAFYGRVITQRYDQPAEQLIDEQRFAYPLYVVFLLAPTVHVAFADAQTWALVILVILTAASVPLWLDVLHWRLSKVTSAGLILFILSSPQIVQGLRLRQLGLLVAFVIALAAWCVTRNHLATAGAMLAISTIKPQMAVLPLVWFLFWALGNWRERRRLLMSFAITLAVLVGAGEVILPGWLRDFLAGLNAYQNYRPTTSLIEAGLGRGPGRIFAAVLLAALSILAWRNRKEHGTSSEFILTLSAFMVCATLALPLVPPFNQALLLLPVLTIFRNWSALPAFARLGLALTLAWPSLISLALLFWVHPNPQTSSRLPLLPSYGTLLVPFLLLVSLVAGKLRPSTVNSVS